jgi:aminopeptidase YwaD
MTVFCAPDVLFMKRYYSFFITLLALIVGACAPQGGAPTVTVAEIPATPAFVLTTPATASAFDSARAFEHNRTLAVDIGSRVAGTESGNRAADYIASEFAKSGLEVEKQAFEYEGWEDHNTSVELLTAPAVPIEVQAIQYSVGGQVEGEVVAVPGIGSRDDFSKVNVRGKIALVKRGTLSFADKSKNAAEVGAAAILIYNESPTIFGGTLRDRVSIPTLALSGTTGEQLLKQLSGGTVRARIASDAGVIQRTGHNVIGTLKGKRQETIVMGGHYDSVAAGPGAGDNASGTATILELARVMGARPQPEHTLVFIAFDAEELGLFGSRAYVDGLSQAQLAQMRAMLNFDMLGAGGGPLILMGDGNVALLARSSAKQLNIDARNAQLPANAGSDHESFARRGVDTVFFMRNYDLLHTPDDTIDQIKEEFLDEAGRVAERLIERLEATPLKSDSSKLTPTE